MIALDANVLVRLLVADDATQHARTVALLGRGPSADETFFVSEVVLAELVWVLQSRYRFDRRTIASALQALFDAEHVAFESADRCFRALRRYAAGGGGFADYLTAERARDAGATTVATFDAVLLREPGFSAP